MEGGRKGGRERKRETVKQNTCFVSIELDCLLPVVSCSWFQVFLTERDSFHTADIFHHYPVGEHHQQFIHKEPQLSFLGS